MLLPARTKLDKLASKDQSRPAMTSLYLRIVGEGAERRGYLEGTDSYKLGRVPVELADDDTEGFIPVEVIAAARKAKLTDVRANGSLELREYDTVRASFPREDRGQFPDTDRLMELEPARIEGETWRIGLNPRLLFELAEGIGAETVSLEFTATKPAPGPDGGPVDFRPSGLRPIVVRPMSGQTPDAIGLLMPVRV